MRTIIIKKLMTMIIKLTMIVDVNDDVGVDDDDNRRITGKNSPWQSMSDLHCRFELWPNFLCFLHGNGPHSHSVSFHPNQTQTSERFIV